MRSFAGQVTSDKQAGAWYAEAATRQPVFKISSLRPLHLSPSAKTRGGCFAASEHIGHEHQRLDRKAGGAVTVRRKSIAARARRTPAPKFQKNKNSVDAKAALGGAMDSRGRNVDRGL